MPKQTTPSPAAEAPAPADTLPVAPAPAPAHVNPRITSVDADGGRILADAPPLTPLRLRVNHDLHVLDQVADLTGQAYFVLPAPLPALYRLELLRLAE